MPYAPGNVSMSGPVMLPSIKPKISPDIRVMEEEEGKPLIVIAVPEGANKPYFLDGIAYMRAGTEIRVMPSGRTKTDDPQ